MQAQVKTKDLWHVTENDFPPAAAPEREKLKFLIQYALLAPSSHNTQPWLFKIAGESALEIYADDRRWLKIADADRREMHISIGCALENLLIAAARFGYEAETAYFPRGEKDGAPVAAVTLRKGENNWRRWNLFEFLTARSTFHGAFLSFPVPASALREIQMGAAENGIDLHLRSDETLREKIDELIARSDALQFADPEFRCELAYWIKQGVFGNSWLTARLGGFVVSHFDLGGSTAKADHKVMQSAPVFGLITSALDDRTAQLKSGQVFERIYLAARRLNLGVRPMSQIVQIPAHRQELRNLAAAGQHPQQPFLLGYGEFTGMHTPRRSVDEVLIN